MLHHAGLDTTDTCGQAHIDTPLFNNQSTTSHLEQPVWGGHCHYWLNSWLCVLGCRCWYNLLAIHCGMFVVSLQVLRFIHSKACVPGQSWF